MSAMINKLKFYSKSMFILNDDFASSVFDASFQNGVHQLLKINHQVQEVFHMVHHIVFYHPTYYAGKPHDMMLY